MAVARAPANQVGIFANDLCISFRILMHEMLDAHVTNIYEKAKKIHAAMPEPREALKTIFERGIKSVNTWDSTVKERYRAQVSGQYRQISDLYQHIFLMYVQEMYDQSLHDVTVRVTIPSLSNMLYTFLRLSCNHSSVCYGEYITDMNFSARVLFVETILRRMLYELLVQQNNIRGITSKTVPNEPVTRKPDIIESTKPFGGPAGGGRVHKAIPAAPVVQAVTVVSDDDNLSQDITLGSNHRFKNRPTRLSPTIEDDTNRFWRAPESNVSAPIFTPSTVRADIMQKESVVSSNLSQTSMSKSTSKASNVNSKLSHHSQNSKISNVSSKQSHHSQQSKISDHNSKASSKLSSTTSKTSTKVSENTLTNVSAEKDSGVAPAPVLSLAPDVPPSSPALVTDVVKPINIVTMAPATVKAPIINTIVSKPALAPTVAKPEPVMKPAVNDKKDTAPNNAATPVHTKPVNNGIFDINSQFTPHKPWGKMLPEPQLVSTNRPDIEVDSLNLEQSNMSFGDEINRFFNDTSQTITPFDSVTEVAAGNRRPPLFFPSNTIAN